ncbi:MAG: hypothetical protein U0667_17815 [Chloroflexota bacterium]
MTGMRMHFEGSVPIKADRATVLSFVNDPTFVASRPWRGARFQVVDDSHSR